MTDRAVCSVEGCEQTAFAECDLCQSLVCEDHARATVCLELCPGCFADVQRESGPDYTGVPDDAEEGTAIESTTGQD